MTEHPILFSGPMVRAILEGRKTQTRRVVKVQPGQHCKPWLKDGLWKWLIAETGMGVSEFFRCPYGTPSDRLWVRETFAIVGVEGRKVSVARAERMPAGKSLSDTDGGLETIEVDRDTAAWATQRVDCERWKPAIFMPRWACRIVLDVTAVRVERLQSISNEDAEQEGVQCQPLSARGFVDYYRELWDSINGKRGMVTWTDNPWVWVVTFRKLP